MTEVENKDKGHTYRRYQEGEDAGDWELQEKIFQGDTSHKCPTYIHKTPPCQGSCPSGHEVRGWLAIARGMDKPPVEGMDWQEYAFNRMIEANAFPATMGRVCPAPCEDGCNRNELDDTVGINSIEHFVGDYAIENKLKLPEVGADSGYRVAIVGGGPGGLSAAFNLRLKGHAVTLYDSHAELGGMMRFGIPQYRTPREMLDAEIGRIVDLGIDLKLNTTVGVDISMKELEDDFDAIIWAIGAQNGRGLFAEGWENTENCISAIDFLDVFNKGWVAGTAQKVVVVGGGDTSIDVASVARRLGHITKIADKDAAKTELLGYAAHDAASAFVREGVKTVLTSILPIDDMTAAEHEREDANREGVDIQGSIMPLEVIKDKNGLARALKVVECVVDAKMIPSPKEGAEPYELECDMIVSAIGQFGDLTGFEELDGGRGFMNVDTFYHVKGQKKHFAIGDIVRPHLLTTAIGHASIACESVHDFLDNSKIDLKNRPKVDVHHFSLLNELHRRDLEPSLKKDMGVETTGTASADWAVHNYEDRSYNKIIPHDELFMGHFEFEDRYKRDHVLVQADQVIGNFEERLKQLTEEEAQKEGERCMSCGMCFECDNCVIYCPQDAVFKVKKDQHAVGRYVDTDYNKCIGCHICADVCPTGYIEMGLE